MNRSRWLILAWTLAHFHARGQDTRRQRQLPAAIGASAACEARALMRAAFTRETRTAPAARHGDLDMQIIDPAGSSAAAARTLAKRPSSLEGVTIALLDNSKPNAAVLLARVGELLAARSGARAVRAWGKPGSSIGASTTVLEEIASEARVALTASAD